MVGVGVAVVGDVEVLKLVVEVLEVLDMEELCVEEVVEVGVGNV
jgi:hypothetical protein